MKGVISLYPFVFCPLTHSPLHRNRMDFALITVQDRRNGSLRIRNPEEGKNVITTSSETMSNQEKMLEKYM